MSMLTAEKSLVRLREGNQRYLDGNVSSSGSITEAGQEQLVQGQNPHTIILGCADSRVPVELIFDQQAGDLFVVRVAGNVAATSQIASIEYAVANLGTPLVVVLGHTQCGAVAAAVNHLIDDETPPTPALQALVSLIQPGIESLQDAYNGDKEALNLQAMRHNVSHSVTSLIEGSELLRESVSSGQIQIVGAEYSIATGGVEFFT